MSIVYKLTDNIIDFIKPYIKDKSNDKLEITKYRLNLFLWNYIKFYSVWISLLFRNI